jgi:DNA-binding transcriptional LysR family regulator
VSIENVDLNLLQVLHLVLAEKSVARAARRLHVTPSAISNALARLRVLLGDSLVTRKGRGIVPTPRAAELAPTLATALRDLDTALFASRFDAATCTRTFTLALADAGQLTYGSAIVVWMATVLPRARLQMIGIDSLLALGNLASPEIDLHFGVPSRERGLHAEPLVEERTVLVARVEHPVARRRVSPRTLETLSHVGVNMVPARGLRDPVADAYRRAGVRREVAISVATFTAAVAIVSRTDLVTTVPESMARRHAVRFGVGAIAGAIPQHRVELGLSWHERTHADPASIVFRDVVRRAIRSAASGTAPKPTSRRCTPVPAPWGSRPSTRGSGCPPSR